MATHTDGTDLNQILARDWKGFEVAGCHYLLHIPSMHLLEVDQTAFTSVIPEQNPEAPDKNAQQRLDDFVEKLGPLPKRQPQPTKISSIALNVAEQCNLRCAYCYAGDGNYGEDSIMAENLATQTIDFFLEQTDFLQVIFFGGEPLLNFKLIKQVVEYCESKSDKRFSFSITTNGMLLTKEHLSYFKAHGFSLTMSYDGKEIHDRQRLLPDKTRGSEAVVLKKLSILKQQISELRRFQIRGTIQSNHLKFAERAIADAASTLPHATMLALAADQTPFAKARADLDLVLDATKRVVRDMLAKEQYQDLKKMTAIWHFIVLLHRGATTTSTCHAGLNYLSVSTSGEFFLCHRFTEDSRARIGSLKDGLDHERIESIRQHRLTKHEPCNSCWMRGVCGGGCFHENMLAHQTFFEADPKFCYLQDGQMRLAVEVYVTLRNKAPQLLDGQTPGFRTEELSPVQ